ncbi:AP-2 complex subunit sigma [Phytophthora cinnamomi]|uniref:AP-2 complex subunit sigma n=1 Tax=Phytophthora cinnamomi TaxID=4785 RepID=UPI003559FC3A|nr:AP-2 complex subunit sigma [Phytophthora cinnamomi]
MAREALSPSASQDGPPQPRDRSRWSEQAVERASGPRPARGLSLAHLRRRLGRESSSSFDCGVADAASPLLLTRLLTVGAPRGEGAGSVSSSAAAETWRAPLHGRRARRAAAAPGKASEMIKGILIVNNHGKPRIVKFYEHPDAEQQAVIRTSTRRCPSAPTRSATSWRARCGIGDGVKLIYRHYATLYFVFAVDKQESDLGILDLIQVFVETLDKIFENVRAGPDLPQRQGAYALDEIVGGMVLETNINEVLTAVNEMNRRTPSRQTLAAVHDQEVTAPRHGKPTSEWAAKAPPPSSDAALLIELLQRVLRGFPTAIHSRVPYGLA